MSTKGWPQLPEQKPGVLTAFSGLLELTRIVHGNKCFIEHPTGGILRENPFLFCSSRNGVGYFLSKRDFRFP